MTAAVWLNGSRVRDTGVFPALTNYGHFTSMQVRGGAVQGLAMHLARLQQATVELFCTELDLDQLRMWIRTAMVDARRVDASVRVTVFSADFDFRQPARPVAADVLVGVSAPAAVLDSGLHVQPVRYQRPFAAIKHVGMFDVFQHRRQAVLAGFDDALFIGPGEVVLEGTTWNLVLGGPDGLVWPEGECLPGITRALLEQALATSDVSSERGAVVLGALPGFDAAVACNATGLRPVDRIGDVAFPASAELAGRLQAVMAGVPWAQL